MRPLSLDPESSVDSLMNGVLLRPPAERLTPFRRSYASLRGVELEYPPHFQVRRVHPNGELNIDGRRIYLSGVLAHELVGLDQVDDDYIEIYFGSITLGCYDRRTGCIVKDLPPAKK